MKPLRVLLVEDSPDDEALLRLELKRAGWAVTCLRVETAEAMRAALEESSWDVVLSDYHLPTFSAPEALAVLSAVAPEVPLIDLATAWPAVLAVTAVCLVVLPATAALAGLVVVRQSHVERVREGS